MSQNPPDKSAAQIRVNGDFYSAGRDGVPISEEEYRRHEAERGPNGECPVCGRVPGPPISVRGPHALKLGPGMSA